MDSKFRGLDTFFMGLAGYDTNNGWTLAGLSNIPLEYVPC